MHKNLIPDGLSLLVVGSLNDHEADRSMKRSSIRSVQVIGASQEADTAEFFSRWGICGVSSMAFDPVHSEVLYVATSRKIVRVDCSGPKVTELEIDGLEDIHEMTVVGNDLLIANTGNDEIVKWKLDGNGRIERINLKQYSDSSPPHATTDEEMVDTFHCNQGFEDLERNLCVLVHHIEGRQILKRIAQKILKSQGTGGVLELKAGRKIPLNLKAPHTVRTCGDQYVVLNSGHFLLQVYDEAWTLLQRVSTEGFGRGGQFDQRSGLFFAGVSATRKRYLDIIPTGKTVENTVLVFSSNDWMRVGQIDVHDIEQINNVYLIPAALGQQLLSLDARLESFALD